MLKFALSLQAEEGRYGYKGAATEEEEEEKEGGCNISPRPKGEITKPLIFAGN